MLTVVSPQVLAGALMSDADFSNSNLQEAVLTKVWHTMLYLHRDGIHANIPCVSCKEL